MSNRPPVLRPSPLGLADMFSGTWAVLRRRGGLLLGITLVAGLVAAAIIFIPVMAVVLLGVFSLIAALESNSGSESSPSLWMITPIVVLCAAAVGAASVWVWARFNSMLVAVVDQLARGLEPSWTSAENQTRGAAGRAMPLVWLGAAAAAVVGALVSIFLGWVLATRQVNAQTDETIGAVAFLLLTVIVVAGIYLQIRLVYALPALALEGHRGLDALRRSFALTKGRFWRTTGFLLVGCGLPYLFSMVFQGGQQGLKDNPDLVGLLLLVSLLSTVVSFMVGVWMSAWQAVMYVDRVRQDGGAVGVQPTPWPWQQSQPWPVQPTPGYPQPPMGQDYPGPTSYPAQPTPQQPGYPADPASNPWARRDNEGL